MFLPCYFSLPIFSSVKKTSMIWFDNHFTGNQFWDSVKALFPRKGDALVEGGLRWCREKTYWRWSKSCATWCFFWKILLSFYIPTCAQDFFCLQYSDPLGLPPGIWTWTFATIASWGFSLIHLNSTQKKPGRRLEPWKTGWLFNEEIPELSWFIRTNLHITG